MSLIKMNTNSPAKTTVKGIFNTAVLIYLVINLIGALFSVISLPLLLLPIYRFYETDLGTDLPTDYYIVKVLITILSIALPICCFVISFQLYRFFLAITKGNYFERANGIRLRWIGFATIVGTVLLILLHFSYSYILSLMYADFSEAIDLTNLFFILPGFFFGLMSLIVAEAFMQGNKISEENKLTV